MDAQFSLSAKNLQTRRWSDRLLIFFDSPRAARILLALALLLALPSLGSGLIADDHYHAARLLAAGIDRSGLLPGFDSYSLFDLFGISDGSAPTNRALVERGALPWWTDPNFRFQLWRPLAELSHWLDYRLWPTHPWLMHLHHLLWFALLLVLALRFYRRTLPADPALAIFAFALYALSANLSQTVTWLAARNTLMAATLGLTTLLIYIKAEQSGLIRYRLTACVVFSLALLASEFGLGISTWLFAWTLVMGTGSLLRKGLRLLPFGLIMLAWLMLYRSGQYGVAGSEFYLDPPQHPADYLLALLQRGIDLAFMAAFGFSTGMLGMSTAKLVGWLLALSALLTLAWQLRPHWRQPLFRFWLTGSLLSILPIAAGPGGARTLAFVSLGMAPLIAMLLRDWIARPASRSVNILLGFLTSCLLVGIVARPATAYIMQHYDSTYITTPAITLPISADDADRAVILLNPHSLLHAILFPVVRAERGLLHSAQLFPLASGLQPIQLLRDAEDSLVLTTKLGFLQEPAAYFVRRREQGFKPGQQLRFNGMTVTVLSVDAQQQPLSARFGFGMSLNSAGLVLLQCENMKLHRFTPPKMGASVLLPACN